MRSEYAQQRIAQVRQEAAVKSRHRQQTKRKTAARRDRERRAEIKAQIKKMPSGCYEWQGYCHPVYGYGQIHWHGRIWPAHRLQYVLTKRVTLTRDQYVCHSCDNRACVRISHLWIGTHADNQRDMGLKGRTRYSASHYTHCKRGHELTGENLYVDPKGARNCRICARARERLKLGWSPELAYSVGPQR